VLMSRSPPVHMLKLARLAWLSPVPIAVRSGRINRSYIGKYESLSLAEEKAQANVRFNIAIEPPFSCSHAWRSFSHRTGYALGLKKDAANKNMRATRLGSCIL
jgi:hypothetical protein